MKNVSFAKWFSVTAVEIAGEVAPEMGSVFRLRAEDRVCAEPVVLSDMLLVLDVRVILLGL